MLQPSPPATAETPAAVDYRARCGIWISAKTGPRQSARLASHKGRDRAKEDLVKTVDVPLVLAVAEHNAAGIRFVR